MLEVGLVFALLLSLIASLSFYSLWQKEKASRKPSASPTPQETIFDTIATPICIKQGTKWEINKAFTRAFGTHPKEIFAYLDTFPKQGAHNVDLSFDNGVKKGVQLLFSTILDTDNSPIGYTCVIVDLSTLHKNKEHLLTQKERLDLAIENVGDGIWDWDFHNDTLFFSKRWKEIMGYGEHESPSKLSSWLNLVHPKDMALVNERLAAYLDGRSEFFCVEHRIRASEPLKWVSVRGKALFDKHNKAMRMTGTLCDISLRKEDEDAERKQLALFNAFFENLPAIAFVKNIQGEYIYLNTAFQRFLGFKTWQKKTALQLFDVPTAEAMEENDRLTLYEDKTKHDITLPTENGTMQAFIFYQFPIDIEAGEKLICGFGIIVS